MNFLKSAFAVLIVVCSNAVSVSAQNAHVAMTTGVLQNQLHENNQPNIIVIMADDLGFGDLSCYGATAIETPSIDRLAREGIRFTSGYCSASTCTPTRYSFLTGNYAFRRKGTGIAPPSAPAIIQPGTETIASILKKAGYSTAVIGKWHLGLGGTEGPDWNGELRPGPLEIGFDTCYLLPTTNDRVPQVYVADHRVEKLEPIDPIWVGDKSPSLDHPDGKTHRSSLRMDWSAGHNGTIQNGISRIGYYTGGEKSRFLDEELADRWVQRSVRFIEDNKDQPFFLFFSSHDIHVPRMPGAQFQGKSSLGLRGDAILELDWCVGQLLATIDRLSLAESTLIVFCSDNGPVLDDGYKDGAIEKNGNHRAAGPFSGGKYSVYEGGTRTPFITRWTGRIAPGVSDEIVCTIDLAASAAALTGVPLSDGDCVDSENVVNALLGIGDKKGRTHLVQQNNNGNGTFGFRDGPWKLLQHDQEKTYNLVVESRLATTKVSRFQLFDLGNDPGEKNNVIAQHPEDAKRLVEKLGQIIADGRSR